MSSAHHAVKIHSSCTVRILGARLRLTLFGQRRRELERRQDADLPMLFQHQFASGFVGRLRSQTRDLGSGDEPAHGGAIWFAKSGASAMKWRWLSV
jgi:hypothetical protein